MTAIDPQAEQLHRIKQTILDRFPRDSTPNIGLLEQAFEDAETHHRGQLRRSGEPVLIHPYRVALLVAETGLDVDTVIVALLHDLVEDTEVTKAEIGERYGELLAEMVDGLTKVPKPRQAGGRDPNELENYRKLLTSTARDIRTLLVKVFDRLDNMRDLSHLDRSRQRRISTETLLVYVPMAQRMGLHDIAEELATLCFRFLYPNRFKRRLEELKALILLEMSGVNAIKTILDSALAPLNFPEFDVKARFHQVYDLIYEKQPREQALRAMEITVPTAQDCYRGLGALHMTCRAVPNSIRDYISNPKPNRYQGLESQIFVGGEAVRIVITSREMETVNRKGILANWRGPNEELSRYYQNYLELLDHVGEGEDLRMEDVLRYAQMETMQIFTPKGERKNLPSRSTVLDFAFAIHTDLGIHCRGALVGGRKVSPFAELKDGDMVEVLSADNVLPNPEWLDAVRTTRARLALRRALRAQSLARAEEVGKTLLSAELARLGEEPSAVMGSPEFKKALRRKGLSKAHFYQRIGTRRLNLRNFLAESGAVSRKKVQRRETWERSLLMRYLLPMFRSPSPDLKVRRSPDSFIQMSRCCTPLYGDPIVGVRREHGIAIHRNGCAMLKQVPPDTMITVGWDDAPPKSTYRVRVLAEDRAGVLYKIGKVLHGLRVNVHDMAIDRDESISEASIVIDIEPVSTKTYRKIVGRLRGLKEVRMVS